jgi:tyrosine-protein kinase Etk/Wzc
MVPSLSANGSPHEHEAPVVASWLGMIGRRWMWGAGVFLVVLGATVAFILIQRPIYRAEARVRLADPPPMSGLNPSASMLSMFGVGGSAFANDLQLLGSRSLRESVVAERTLQAQLIAPPGWTRDSLLVSLSAGRETEKAAFELTWTPDGSLVVTRTAPTESVLGTFAPGTPVLMGGVTAVFHPRRQGTPESFGMVTVPFAEAVRQAEGRIVAQRAARDAQVLDVSYDDPDGALAEQVVESTVAHFTALRAAVNQRESGETVDSLRVVLEKTRAELALAENELESLQRESGLVSAEAQSEALIGRYSQALFAEESTRAELDLLGAALGRVNAAENPGEAWLSLAAHPQFLENETIGGLLGRMALLEEQRIQLASVRALENVQLRTVHEQIAQLDTSLRTIARNLQTGLAERLRLVEGQVAAMEAQLGATPRLMMQLGRRQRDLRVLNEVAVLTEQRLRQEELRQALTFANVQVIDPAALRYRPIWPRKKLMLAAGLLLASGFAALAMIVVERTDRSVRSARQLAPYMTSPLLAAVAVARTNGRVGGFELTPVEVEVLLRRGRMETDGRSRLLVLSAGAQGDAEELARAVERVAGNGGGSEHLKPSLTVLTSVGSRAAAEAVAREGVPVLLVLRAGETESDDVARTLGLLSDAGAPVAGGVLLCRSTREAHIAWS